RWRTISERCAALRSGSEPSARGLLGRDLHVPRPGASRPDERASGKNRARQLRRRTENLAMRAYPAAAMLQEMRSLRPGSDLTDRLDDALATKLVGVLRFRRHHFMAALCEPRLAADTFLAQSVKEQSHADAIARRMVE